jgi:serine/threonine protein kinase
MARRSTRSHNRACDSVRIGGRDWPVIDRLNIGRRPYLILEKTGSAHRSRFMAFDPYAGPGGDLRAILILPRSPAAEQHVRVLKRISANNINLPTILEYRTRQDELLVVLTWVRGMDLHEFLKRIRDGQKPRPSATEAFRLVRGLAHGLAQLHRRHAIVHGDLKPANLILASAPSRLVMIDFGSAWGAEWTTTKAEGDGISRAYAAPELQSPGKPVDFRSDQFSASVVLYELLTLERPYDRLGGQAGRPEMAGRMAGKLIPPSRLSPDRYGLPRDLWAAIDEVILTGLALQPDDRYPTCSVWLQEFDRVYTAMRPASALSPLNARLTRVVDCERV